MNIYTLNIMMLKEKDIKFYIENFDGFINLKSQLTQLGGTTLFLN